MAKGGNKKGKGRSKAKPVEIDIAEKNADLNMNEAIRANSYDPTIADNIRRNASPQAKRILMVIAAFIIAAIVIDFVIALLLCLHNVC